MLYELLTGTTPFDRKRLDTAGYDEMRRDAANHPRGRSSQAEFAINDYRQVSRTDAC